MKTSRLSLFVKCCVLALLITFSNIAYAGDPANDLKRLKQTVQSIGEQIMAKGESPTPLFMLSLEEFRPILLKADKDATEEDVFKRFEKLNARVTEKYARLKRELGQIKSIGAFDTITYVQESAKAIDIFIEFTVEDRWTKKDKTASACLSFLVVGNQLKFAPSIREISFFHYTLHELDLVKTDMRKAFIAKSPSYFNTSVTNMVPFEKNRKFGLKSLKGEILVASMYDSISTFVGDYANVKAGGRYNLLDRKFKPVFPKAKKHIKLVDEKYWMVMDESGQYKPYPEVEEVFESVEVAVEEPISDTMDEQPRQRNQDPAVHRRDSLYQASRKQDYEIRRSPTQGDAPNVHQVISNATKETLATFNGFEFIDPQGSFLCGRRNDSTFVMTPSGKILFKSNFVCKYERPGYLEVFDRTTRRFGLYCPYTNVYIKPVYAYVEAIDRDRFFVVMTKKGKVGYLDAVGKELFD